MARKIFLIWTLCFSQSFGAECTGHFVNPFTDICWDCLFPITIGRSAVVKGSYPDALPNPKNILCSCANNPIPIGFSLGYWEPFSMVDVTRKPYCMVNLGIEIDMDMQGLGGSQMPSEDGRGAFYHVHWYKYPLIYLLQIIASEACMQVDDIDIAYLTELDPTWNDSTLSFILSPESSLFTNPLARGMCAVDATTTLGGFSTAIDSLFWCQGAQGSTYPISGHMPFQTSPISAATLLAERMNFKMHREGLVWDSMGIDGHALCYTYPMPIMPKSRYRYQMVNTIPEAKSCHPFGQSVTTWETGHMLPDGGDNFGFLIWKKRNCCFL